jgi:hypothetical protein
VAENIPATPNELLVDINEPDRILLWLQQGVPAKKAVLNIKGFADYMWVDCNNNLCQVERKQWAELLSNVDGVEAQLRRYMPNTTEIHLLVEGVAEPTATGIDCYHKSKGKPYYHNNWSFGKEGRAQPGAYSKVQAWFWQLDKCGVTVHETSCEMATAYAIAAWYKNSQKEEHTTLNRYYKERVVLEHHNPDVASLMGLEGAGLGEVKAKLLIQVFGSFWGVMTADIERVAELPGFGVVTAKKLFRAIGRPDIW